MNPTDRQKGNNQLSEFQTETYPLEESMQRIAPGRMITDPDLGLSPEEVSLREQNGEINTPVDSPVKTVKQIIISNTCTYFNFIFIVIAAALIACRSFNHLMFLPIMIANTVIGIIQEIRSKKTLEKLSLLNAPHSLVIRGGKAQQIITDELVLDDIAVLSAGDQIAADAVVSEGSITVNEALITGEADEITKLPGDELLSGSFVISGSCRAQIVRVGKDSFASRLTLAAKKTKRRDRGGMMKSLTTLIGVIGIAIIPIAALLIYKQHITLGMSLTDSIVSSAAAILGIIPEGLYLLVSVALAVSVIRLSKKRTLVHELKSIETLARTDVICVDKTGTITENKMEVTDIRAVPGNSAFDRERAEQLITDFAAAMSSDNNTMAAIKEHFDGESTRTAAEVIPFSSKNKYSAVRFNDGCGYFMGAPEFILGDRFAKYSDFIGSLSSEGYRVLLFAYCKNNDVLEPDGAVPLFVILLSNKIRERAKETFEYFASQNVDIKVISGDNPATAANAAAQAGIPNSEKYIDASTVRSHEELAAIADKYTVFGRVTPDQKKTLVKALKKAGHTVAMTGDGVNDVLALKEADCSIAMASGSDVASQVAQIVLLDSDFSAMPAVVAEGRRVINNIERSAALFLVKNIFSFFLAWITIIGTFAYPVTPAQLSLINVLTIGAPSFFLALEPNTNIVRGKFLRNVLLRAAPAAITDILVIFGTMLFSVAFDIPQSETSTISAMLIAVVGFVMLFRVCTPFNTMRRILFGTMMSGFVLGFAFAADLFSMSPLSFGGILVFIVFAILVFPINSAVTRMFVSIPSGIRKLIDRIKNSELIS